MTLEQALADFKAEFPGWWWSVGECYVSCDATVAPDRYGADDDLLQHRLFDNGFRVDLRQPSTVVDALLSVTEKARAARTEYRSRAG